MYTLENYHIVPKPLQKPPPIWIAVSPDREQAGDSRRSSDASSRFACRGYHRALPPRR
jgi:hypothetical protein